MAADYDLVILGGTLEGRYGALTAAQYGARVALVEPPGVFDRRAQAKYLLRGLQQLGEGRSHRAVSKWFERSEHARTGPENFDWLALLRWSAIAAKTQSSEIAADRLSTHGVDIIFAMPEILSRRLELTVANRKFKSRAVLAAFGSVPLPVFEGLPALTGVERLLGMKSLPRNIYIWGGTLIAVEWAQALNAMGVSVSLVAECFLPDEDSEIRGWMRSRLTATGIQFTSPSKLISNHNTQELSQHSLLLDHTKPALELPSFAQTAHSRVLGCGSLLHGEFVGDVIAQAEAQVAVWNALFVPNRRVHYGSIPHSHHQFARVGQTPRFAKEGYAPSGDYSTWTASSANSTTLSQALPSPSHCKLICKKERLQSIHLIGDGAGQLADTLSAMIGKPIHQLLNFTSPTPTGTEGLAGLIQNAASQSQRARWQPYHWRRDWAENWFNWRRSR
ncbi:MAG: FAD-dependent oxidoreductase [Cyanobacteria bacterium J06629_19]